MGASHAFISASCAKDLGLEVETIEELLYVNFPLGARICIDKICLECELEMSGTQLMEDLRVM